MATIPGVVADQPVVIEWGNSVAAELNNECIKRNGTRVMTAALTLVNANPTDDNHATRKKYVDDIVLPKTGGTITGALTVNGLLTANAQILISDALPTAANHATRKDYVDDVRNDCVAITGDTMTGTLGINPTAASTCLLLRSQATGTGGALVNAPNIGFYNNTTAIRYGYIQASSGSLYLVSETGDVTLNSGGGQVRSSDAIYAAGASRFRGDTISVLGTGGYSHCQFYASSTSVDTIGSRNGYVGIANGHMHLRNEGTNSHMYMSSDGYQLWATGVPGAVSSGGLSAYEKMRLDDSGVLMVGKTSSGLTVEGVSIFGGGAINVCQNNPGGTVPLALNYLNSSDNHWFIQFARNGTTVGRIEQVGTTGAAMVSGSDYRMKTVVGPINNAIERIKALKPYRVTWNGDPSRGETDAFLAHEVEPVVPEAVSGTKDAVTGPPEDADDPPEGTPIMQGMAYEKLIAVTVAALQNVIGRVEALEGVA